MTRKKTQNTATSQNKLSYQSYAVVSQGYVLAMPSRGKRYLFKKKKIIDGMLYHISMGLLGFL